MNHRSIRIKTLITIFSILTVGLEYGSYYFLDTLYIPLLVSLVVNLIFAHIYLETSLTYLSFHLQASLTGILSAAATFVIYYYQTGHLLIYNNKLPLLVLLNWLVPLCYGILRNFMDRGPRFVQFKAYFFRTSIIFSLYYLYFFVHHYFLSPTGFPKSASLVDKPFIPFLSTATYIEDAIYLGQPLDILILYLIKSILLFVPIGFYASLLLKEASRIYLVLLALLLPPIPVLVSYLRFGTYTIDAYIYHLIGFVLGVLLYQFLNHLSNRCLQSDFLADRSKYSFFNYYY
ncbi:MAG: hypothetical protein PWP24_912 [Clostridiales bacterium]|nr:hypothetical protein [Clostridiales bacterium]